MNIILLSLHLIAAIDCAQIYTITTDPVQYECVWVLKRRYYWNDCQYDTRSGGLLSGSPTCAKHLRKVGQ